MRVVYASAGVAVALVCGVTVWVLRGVDEACRFIGRMES